MPHIDKQPQGKIFHQEFGHGAPIGFTNAALLTRKRWDNQVAIVSK